MPVLSLFLLNSHCVSEISTIFKNIMYNPLDPIEHCFICNGKLKYFMHFHAKETSIFWSHFFGYSLFIHVILQYVSTRKLLCSSANTCVCFVLRALKKFTLTPNYFEFYRAPDHFPGCQPNVSVIKVWANQMREYTWCFLQVDHLSRLCW